MVTWVELAERGVVETRENGRLAFDAPEGLEEELRAEIYRRVPTMVNPPRVALAARCGICDACGETLTPFVGGWCPLCTAARVVALRDPE